MRVHIGDIKLLITTGHQTFYFELPKDVENNLKHEIDYFLAEHTVKEDITQLFFKYKHGNDAKKLEKTKHFSVEC